MLDRLESNRMRNASYLTINPSSMMDVLPMSPYYQLGRNNEIISTLTGRRISSKSQISIIN